MGKPTPERALSLAEQLSQFMFYDSVSACDAEVIYEAAAILRDYADLRRKWDTVVNAEPLAYASRHSDGERFILHYGDMNLWENQPLIRKPE